MNIALMRKVGFDKEMDLVEAGKCPFCEQPIPDGSQFRDPQSLAEYKVSGICQACQDKIFGDKHEPEQTDDTASSD